MQVGAGHYCWWNSADKIDRKSLLLDSTSLRTFHLLTTYVWIRNSWSMFPILCLARNVYPVGDICCMICGAWESKMVQLDFEDSWSCQCSQSPCGIALDISRSLPSATSLLLFIFEPPEQIANTSLPAILSVCAEQEAGGKERHWQPTQANCILQKTVTNRHLSSHILEYCIFICDFYLSAIKPYLPLGASAWS
jgi:hypothetical protein